ncbi:MAG: saccharopine dehydrogenase C-terminal domain-containing protein [Candidatus Thermoplasmatota archaeon]
MRVIVFGGGIQGRVIAADLAGRDGSPEVVVMDVRAPTAKLPEGVSYEKVDALEGGDVSRVVRGADVAVLALPGGVARRALENIVAAGASTVDVSFTPEPPLDLDERARKSGARVIVDCGVAPGLSHVLAGAAHHDLGGLDSLRILVGGLPERVPPHFRHAVYFNARDLVAEYLRPARRRNGGRDEAPAPLDAPAERHVDEELGALDAFLSDGLRSLLTSYPEVPDMEERTLRWPGHLEFMRGLRAAGLLDEVPLPGAPEATADSTARALATRYPGEAHPDVLVMEVVCTRGGHKRSWRLIDRRTGSATAMSRTTAFTAAAVAWQLARGRFTEAGVHAPERLGSEPALVRDVLHDLGERGVRVVG